MLEHSFRCVILTQLLAAFISLVIGWVIFVTAYAAEIREANRYYATQCDTWRFEMVLTKTGGYSALGIRSSSESCIWQNINLFSCPLRGYTACVIDHAALFNRSGWDCVLRDCQTDPRLDSPEPMRSTAGVLAMIFLVNGVVILVTAMIRVLCEVCDVGEALEDMVIRNRNEGEALSLPQRDSAGPPTPLCQPEGQTV